MYFDIARNYKIKLILLEVPYIKDYHHWQWAWKRKLYNGSNKKQIIDTFEMQAMGTLVAANQLAEGAIEYLEYCLISILLFA